MSLGFVFLLADDVGHGLFEIFLFGLGELVWGGFGFAEGADFAAEAAAGGADAFFVGEHGAGVGGVDVHGGGGGDGVLVGGQEEEVPTLLALLGNQVADVRASVAAGCILVAVGEDGEDDGRWFVLVWQIIQPGSGLSDGAANGIEERGAATRDKVGCGHLTKLLQ